MKTVKIKASKHFVVDCNTWLRGEGHEKSYLVRLGDGKMCCIGFYAKSCGIPVAELEGIQNSSDCTYNIPKMVKPSREADTPLCHDLVEINDTCGISDKQRMSMLRAGFAEAGIKVVFINQPQEVK